MSEVSVAQLEAMRASQVALLQRRHTIERLLNNPDFKTVIMDGFCRDDAARYVQESGDPMLDERQRSDALAMAMASGHLKRFLAITLQLGTPCESNIAEIDQALIEIQAGNEDESV